MELRTVVTKKFLTQETENGSSRVNPTGAAWPTDKVGEGGGLGFVRGNSGSWGFFRIHQSSHYLCPKTRDPGSRRRAEQSASVWIASLSTAVRNPYYMAGLSFYAKSIVSHRISRFNLSKFRYTSHFLLSSAFVSFDKLILYNTRQNQQKSIGKPQYSLYTNLVKSTDYTRDQCLQTLNFIALCRTGNLSRKSYLFRV